jgi:hypothetical protein
LDFYVTAGLGLVGELLRDGVIMEELSNAL